MKTKQDQAAVSPNQKFESAMRRRKRPSGLPFVCGLHLYLGGKEVLPPQRFFDTDLRAACKALTTLILNLCTVAERPT